MNYIVHGVTKSWTSLSDFHFTSTLDRDGGYLVVVSEGHLSDLSQHAWYLLMAQTSISGHWEK